MFADKLSGKNTDREVLAKALDYLRPGDTLVSLKETLDTPRRPRRLVACDSAAHPRCPPGRSDTPVPCSPSPAPRSIPAHHLIR
ncbi:hypothetical protein ACQEUU_21225 [Nonomuraea sp. CA-218870]|uniref:hypothetical protein n=1 Tax=Nonomuraea sp. CA-218870 TaxID=3239998 RepID=UPI003D912619